MTDPTQIGAAMAGAEKLAVTKPYDRLKIFGGLVLVILVCVPVLSLSLGRAELYKQAEASAVLRAKETALRALDREHEELSWLIPSQHGEHQLDPPPLSTWLIMAGWRGLDVQRASPEALVERARWVSIFMAVVALLSTYWAGMSVGDVRVARLATLALGTTVLFVEQSRTAGSQAQMLGWITLAVAAGLWAMRPLKEINWVGRRVFGWFISGLAMAGAALTQGPVPALLFVLPPLLMAIVLTPRRRIDNSLGLTFAVILGLIAASPWYLYVLGRLPQATPSLLPQRWPLSDLLLVTWSHARALLVLSPWTVWLIGGLCQPFIRADRQRRRQLLIAWFWCVLAFGLVSIPASHSIRALWPLLPAASLMVGQLWAYHAQLSTERQVDRGANWLLVPHWLAIGLTSILGPMFLVFQEPLVERGWLDHVMLPGFAGWEGLLVGVALFSIALLGTRWHFKWRPRAAAYATVAWMLVALAVGLPAYCRSRECRYPFRDQAEQLATVARHTRLYFLPPASGRQMPDAALLLYSDKSLDAISLEDLPEALRQDPGLELLAPAGDQTQRALGVHGLAPVVDIQDSWATYSLFRKP